MVEDEYRRETQQEWRLFITLDYTLIHRMFTFTGAAGLLFVETRRWSR